ncbi:MAG: flagellar filament capping protein FliD, partial [Candidatus Caldatribacteriaceae bacterium]
TLTKTGLLQIEDPETLSEKISQNLSDIEKLFTQGVARDLSQAIQNMTLYGSGTIWVEQNMYREMSETLDKRIASLEEALKLREQRLWTQFTNLEKYLSTMKSQSTWLANQVASLTNQSKSSSS